MMMQLEMSHALSVMCWLIIPELVVREVALPWFTGIRLLFNDRRWLENLIRVYRMGCVICILQPRSHCYLPTAVLRQAQSSHERLFC